MTVPLDTSLLPDADSTLVVMTDTHAMLDAGTQHVEFESRRKQSSRAAYALAKVASLGCDTVVHLGDLVQEYPGGPNFEESLSRALDAFRSAGVTVAQVAGNHDVGDKPDPTMPTEWVTEASLAAFHARFGHSWRSWDADGYHFVILNSQIMNSDLPAAAEQWSWLEGDLAASAGVPTLVFQHLAPFLVHEDEPGLGHYDTIEEPARSRLLGLIREHRVIGVFFGHSHFAFVNRIGDARSWLVPSTAFTRPGFCEVFASGPPPERGRDDAAKLGFFVVRLHDDRPRVHLVRTGGRSDDAETDPTMRQLVTCVSADLPQSPLGMTLRHPMTVETEVPIAWQSVVRQPVRNDFPLLACMELGVRHLRVPASDLVSPLQRERLRLLREEGLSLTVAWVWSPRLDIAALVERYRASFDGVEIQLANRTLPDPACLAAIAELRSRFDIPVMLTTLNPHEHVAGKQHARTRIGYHLDELQDLDLLLASRDLRVDRVLCRVDAGQDPVAAMAGLPDATSFSAIGAIDWAVELQETTGWDQVARASRALVAIGARPGGRLYLEPLVDMDRTMDAPQGLLDRLCNPRPVFHAVRVLNSLLFRTGQRWDRCVAVPADDVLELSGMHDVLYLGRGTGGMAMTVPDGATTIVDLVEGTIGDVPGGAAWRPTRDGFFAFPGTRGAAIT